jgi:glycosyltransferase involved in cell wall biosynthesis
MKITIISHYYPPEIGAPQARLSEMARVWVAAGHEVRVVTCFPNHPTGEIPAVYRDAYRRQHFLEETLDGVAVTRCWVYATRNKGFTKKTLGHLSFMGSSVVQAGTAVRGSDVIVVSSPTFFSVFSAWLLAKRYRIPYVFEVRDLWPAIFVELGVLRNRALIKALEACELYLYRDAAAVVTVTRAFAEDIARRGIDPGKLEVIHNGADVDQFGPMPPDDELVDRHGLRDKRVVMYVGAHGISHALHRIVEVADRLRDRQDIRFVLVGEGAEKERVVGEATSRSLSNVLFIGGQPKEMVRRYYSITDVGLVPLRDIPLFDGFIPSKMFELMAVGKPIVGSVRGEARDILARSGAALVCDPEDVPAITDAVVRLCDDSALRHRLGQSGSEFVRREFSREVLARRYLGVLERCVGASRRARAAR